jgi:hypothetical protein
MLNRLREFFSRRPGQSGRATYLGLRTMVFEVDPDSIDVSQESHLRPAWCALLEFGLEEGTATLLAIADGTVSFYTSSGSGVIGAGEHAAVRVAAERFLEEASDATVYLRPVGDIPNTPSPGHVGIHVRTFDATLSAELPEEVLQRGRHELAPFYAAGQDLLTEVRLLDEAAEQSQE